MNVRLILGGPGAGKTHRLMSVVDEELSNGVPSSSIAFVSFTKKAVAEAKNRAVNKFSLSPSKLPFFRTIHSLCYRQLGIRQSQVFARQHMKELGEILGVSIKGNTKSDTGDEMSPGDQMIFLDNLSRCTLRTLEATWRDANMDDVPWYQLERLSKTLTAYKNDRGLVDFSDMLTQFTSFGAPVGCEVAIIDEAQDLTPIQWEVVHLAFEDCKRMYVAGDDDQAIYAWSGADVEQFLNLSPDHIEVLPVSYRIPRCVFNFAANITNRIETRYQKDWSPRDDEGSVTYSYNPSDVDLSEGTWYLLARNRCFLRALENECVRQGVPYTNRWGSSIDDGIVRAIKLYEAARKTTNKVLTTEDAAHIIDKLGIEMDLGDGHYALQDLIKHPPRIWHDEFVGVPLPERAYYLTALRKGEKLTRPPRVHVDTIHGVKGGEADNVLLMTDQTARTEAGTIQKPDDEARVFYVGATRARKHLHILSPQTNRSYSL